MIPEGFRLRESRSPISVQAAGMSGRGCAWKDWVGRRKDARRQRGVKLTGTAGFIPQEDAEYFYALWQGQGQITLLEANTRYVADDLTLRGTDAMLKLRGERYVAGNLTLWTPLPRRTWPG